MFEAALACQAEPAMAQAVIFLLPFSSLGGADLVGGAREGKAYGIFDNSQITTISEVLEWTYLVAVS